MTANNVSQILVETTLQGLPPYWSLWEIDTVEHPAADQAKVIRIISDALTRNGLRFKGGRK